MSKEILSDLGISPQQRYKKELGKMPLLSDGQEQALAESIERGRLANALISLRDSSTVTLKKKGQARIEEKAALGFFFELGVLDDIALTTQTEPLDSVNKKVKKTNPGAVDKHSRTVDIVYAISRKDEIDWAQDFIDQLQDTVDMGKTAQAQLIQHNLRLAYARALIYFQRGIVPLDDAIQDGNMGLITAACRFERFRQLRFSTLATYWIDQSIQRSIDNTGDSIKIPVHISRKHAKIRKEEATFQQEQGRDPTIEEIAEKLNEPPQEIKRIVQLKEMSKPPSLDAPLTKSSFYNEDYYDRTLRDILVNPLDMSPEQSAEMKDVQTRVRTALLKLSGFRPRHAMYLIARFGLEGKEYTQKELVEKFNVKTPQAISALEASALQTFKQLVEKEDPALLDLLY